MMTAQRPGLSRYRTPMLCSVRGVAWTTHGQNPCDFRPGPGCYGGSGYQASSRTDVPLGRCPRHTPFGPCWRFSGFSLSTSTLWAKAGVPVLRGNSTGIYIYWIYFPGAIVGIVRVYFWEKIYWIVVKTFGSIKLYRIYLCFCFEKYIGYTEKFQNYQNISNIFLENIPDSSENFQN